MCLGSVRPRCIVLNWLAGSLEAEILHAGVSSAKYMQTVSFRRGCGKPTYMLKRSVDGAAGDFLRLDSKNTFKTCFEEDFYLNLAWSRCVGDV